jgi:hypothetical protein
MKVIRLITNASGMLRLLISSLPSATVALAACEEKGKSSLNTREAVESFVERQVKIGASRESVVAALDAKGIEHSGTKDPSAIYAMIRVPDQTAVVQRAFQIKFDFEGGKLSRYAVSEKFTGP